MFASHCYRIRFDAIWLYLSIFFQAYFSLFCNDVLLIYPVLNFKKKKLKNINNGYCSNSSNTHVLRNKEIREMRSVDLKAMYDTTRWEKK